MCRRVLFLRASSWLGCRNATSGSTNTRRRPGRMNRAVFNVSGISRPPCGPRRFPGWGISGDSKKMRDALTVVCIVRDHNIELLLPYSQGIEFVRMRGWCQNASLSLRAASTLYIAGSTYVIAPLFELRRFLSNFFDKKKCRHFGS